MADSQTSFTDNLPEDEPGPSLVPECQQEIEVSSAHESVWGGASSSSGPSFAQTLREGKLKPSPSWPVVQRSVTTPQPRSKAWESEDEEPPGFGIEYQPPEAMSLSAALSAALDKAVLEGSKGPAESSSTSRKKKNKSKKLLFSTGF